MAFLALATGRLIAAEPAAAVGPMPGHSIHGDAFNQGPRQAASLLPGMPQVDFKPTTHNDLARAFVNQGVGQLHGFWYYEAERSFRQAAAHDPQCAIAYWGMAMANVNTQSRAWGFIRKAAALKDHASPRERLYIDALHAFYSHLDVPASQKPSTSEDKNAAGKREPSRKAPDNKKRREAYIKAMEEIVLEFPDDIEAKAFLVFSIWEGKDALPIPSPVAVNALLDQVLAAQPNHPAHHYRIHLWNYVRPQTAVDSSAKSGESGPGIAHLWHMSGHIYSELENYADAAWQQEASARVDHAHMMAVGLLPDQIHNYAHNNEWLCRDLAILGRAGDAVSLARNMIELPRHPKYNTKDKGSYKFGVDRLYDILDNFELWKLTIELDDAGYFAGQGVAEQARRLRARAVAQFQLEDTQGFNASIEALQALRNQRAAAADQAAADALAKLDPPKAPPTTPVPPDGKPADGKATPGNGKTSAPAAGAAAEARKKAERDARKAFDEDFRVLDAALDELRGWRLAQEGKAGEAMQLLDKANVPRRRKVLAAWLAGDNAKAAELAQADAQGHAKQVAYLARQVAALHRAGRQDQAVEAFTRLRGFAAHADLDVSPVFARLAPLAAELGLSADWRTRPAPSPKFGQRPALDTLGPFRWRPSPAPGFTLPDGDGQPLSLASYRGRPVLVVFYLGAGCVHCIEQLVALTDKASDFEKAGIAILAVSADQPEKLQASWKAAQRQGGFPFPLVADPSLEIFKRYRAYDDFESQPLHGSFLIDAQGLIRWQDISHEPFVETKFLLEEAQRLLRMDVK